jgi:alginate O-acetyltransferase complex protein AlgJ
MTMDRRTELASTVIVGKDGWLFHRDDEVVAQMAGQRVLTPTRLAQWRWLLETRHAWLRARGMGYFVLVAPEKHVVYADALPDGVPVTDGRPAAQLVRTLAEHASPVPLVYPVEALVHGRAQHETYFVNDTHWNGHGAMLAWEQLRTALARELAVPEVDPARLERHVEPWDGDLGVRLEPERPAPGLFVRVLEPRAQVVGTNRVFTRGSVVVLEQPDPGLPSAVMFRDSFANLFMHQAAESFRRLVLVSSLELHYELVESERPDVVITELAERCLQLPSAHPLGYFPDDLATVAFEDACRVSTAEVAAWRLRP